MKYSYIMQIIWAEYYGFKSSYLIELCTAVPRNSFPRILFLADEEHVSVTPPNVLADFLSKTSSDSCLLSITLSFSGFS